MKDAITVHFHFTTLKKQVDASEPCQITSVSPLYQTWLAQMKTW